MRFEKAYKGIKKMYAAEWMYLFASIFFGLLSLLVFEETRLVEITGDEDIVSVIALFLVVISLGTLTLGFLINMIGTVQAAQNDSQFRNAVLFEILHIGLMFSENLFSHSTLMTALIRELAGLCSTLVMLYVINGIANLAEKLGDAKMVDLGKKSFSIIMGTYVLSIVLSIVSQYVLTNANNIIVMIVQGSMVLLTIIQYIIYMRYLRKAKNMLKEH